MDTMNQAIEVLTDYAKYLPPYDPETDTEVQLDSLPKHVRQSLMDLALDELTNGYTLVKAANGRLYAQTPKPVKVERRLENPPGNEDTAFFPTVIDWYDILPNITRKLAESIESDAFHDFFIKAVIEQLKQIDIPEGRIFDTFAGAENNSLIIAPWEDRDCVVEVTQNGDWKEIPLHKLDDDLFFIKTTNGQLPLLKGEQDIQQIRHHLIHGDADDFSSLFNFNIVMCDRKIRWQDIECFNGELLTLMLAYRMMPGMQYPPMIYFASEFEEDPMPLLIKLRIRQLEQFMVIGEQITPESMNEPTQSLINALIPMPVSSYNQESALECLEYVTENKHELTAKLMLLAQRVYSIKQAMGDDVYDALLTDIPLRESYLADFYRFVILATPIAFKTRNGVTADKLIEHVVTTQQYLIDCYRPYDALGDAIEQRMSDEADLTITDEYMIWSGSPENILEELNAVVPESDRPGWWPSTAQEMEQLHITAGSFLGRNYGIHTSEHRHAEDKSLTLEYDRCR